MSGMNFRPDTGYHRVSGNSKFITGFFVRSSSVLGVLFFCLIFFRCNFIRMVGRYSATKTSLIDVNHSLRCRKIEHNVVEVVRRDAWVLGPIYFMLSFYC